MAHSATGTLSVNAAFLQEIKEDDRELQQLLEHLSCQLGNPAGAPDQPRQLVESVARLRDRLALHFSLEEAYGYFEDAVAVAPRLSNKAAALRGEHQELVRAVCQIADQAEQALHDKAPPADVGLITNALQEFLSVFRLHESRENELIVESLNDDIGVGD